MGMYDSIIVEADYPLKGLFEKRDSHYHLDGDDYYFQTKDLDRLLDTYTITESGKLLLHKVRYEEDKTRPNRKKKGLLGIVGMLKSIPMGKEEIPYDGILEFYTSYGKREYGTFFVTYNAIFEKGQLKEIKLVNHEVY